MEQVRMPISELETFLAEKLNFNNLLPNNALTLTQ